MADYVLEGPKWGSATLGTAGGTITWAADASVPTDFVATISRAFADWSRAANIQFQEVATTAAAAIDLAFGPIDGPSMILAQTGYDYRGGTLESANVTFDTGESWHESGGAVVSADGSSFFDVALHEIGHAIGLAHYNDAPAIMNAVLNRSVSDLATSDLDGIHALYGETARNLFGSTVHDTSGAPGEVYALYDAIFGRTPDPLGFEAYAGAVAQGASLHDVATALLSSSEAQAHEGGADNAGFVAALYHTALGRTADPGGLQSATAFLDNGGSRADLAISIALSGENEGQMQGAFNAGVFAPDAGASAVARLYYGILGRAPDAGGLSTYGGAVDKGQSPQDVAQAMLASSEFQGAQGSKSDTQFVEGLYQGALGRTADPGGLQSYTGMLAGGTSRAAVAVSIAESDEAKTHLSALIEQGFKLA